MIGWQVPLCLRESDTSGLQLGGRVTLSARDEGMLSRHKVSWSFTFVAVCITVSVKYPINCQGTMKTCKGNNPILRLIYLEPLSCFLNELMTCHLKTWMLLVLLNLIIWIDTNTKFFIPTQKLTSTKHMTSTTLDYTNLSYIHTYWHTD